MIWAFPLSLVLQTPFFILSSFRSSRTTLSRLFCTPNHLPRGKYCIPAWPEGKATLSDMDNDFLDTDTFTWPTAHRLSTGPLRMLNNLNLPDPDIQRSDRRISIQRDTSEPISQFITNYLHSIQNSQTSDWTKVDPRGLEFVTPPNESLLCAICSAPFIKPTELGCEHVFCEECLYEHLTSGIASATKCPKCRTPIDSVNSAAKLLGQLLDDLEVQCPNMSEGCKKELKRYTVNGHIANYCDFEEVACSKADCLHKIPRRLARSECLHTYSKCVTCNEFVMEKDMDVSRFLVFSNPVLDF